mgnify:CR=1 FL=1
MDDSATRTNYVELLKRYKKLRNQLISIIEERESLIKHKFYNLKTDYIKKIGCLEFELYELDVKMGQAKRRIELVDLALEADITVNLSNIETEIMREFEDFEEILKLKDKEIQIAEYFSSTDKISDKEILELKKYYKKTARLIHPDIHSNLSEIQKSLWNKANTAYENGGLIYLKIIYKLAYDESVNMPKLEDYSVDEINSKIHYFEDKIKSNLEDIKELRENFPFNKEELLNDEIKVKEVQRELRQTIREAKDILEIMEGHFLLILDERQYIN